MWVFVHIIIGVAVLLIKERIFQWPKHGRIDRCDRQQSPGKGLG